MIRHLRIQFIAIVVLTLLALCVVLPIPGNPFRIIPGIDLAGGAELRYQVLFEPDFRGDRQEVTRAAADVLRRRVEANQLKEPKINAYGDDRIVVQLAGVDADGLSEYKRLIGKLGKLQLHAAAHPDLQSRFDRDGVVPSGYKAVRNRDRSPLLIQESPVIDGRHILHAEPREELDSGAIRWVTSFELNAEGARRFDEAAERLYHQQPRGRIVILLDGEVRSAPVVQSPAFHGRGQISGSRE